MALTRAFSRIDKDGKRRSIPRIQGPVYLDLYMLDKEKERLLKEDERLCMRKDAIKKRLKEIDLKMNKLQGSEANVKVSVGTSFSEGTFTQINGAAEEWKKMSLNY